MLCYSVHSRNVAFVQTQFGLILSHTVYNIYVQCDFPRWALYLLSSYMLLMLTLFTNFYIHAYIMKRRSGDRRELGQGDGLTTDTASSDYTNGLIADNTDLKKMA